jgi:hypothetical protein
MEEENAHLKTRLAKAKEVFRSQEAKYAELAAAYEAERQARIKYERDKDYWLDAYREHRAQAEDLEDQLKKAGIQPRPNYQWLQRGPALDDVLKQILSVVHPDKWQTQTAAVLAHEVTLLVNQLREHNGRQA